MFKPIADLIRYSDAAAMRDAEREWTGGRQTARLMTQRGPRAEGVKPRVTFGKRGAK